MPVVWGWRLMVVIRLSCKTFVCPTNKDLHDLLGRCMSGGPLKSLPNPWSTNASFSRFLSAPVWVIFIWKLPQASKGLDFYLHLTSDIGKKLKNLCCKARTFYTAIRGTLHVVQVGIPIKQAWHYSSFFPMANPKCPGWKYCFDNHQALRTHKRYCQTKIMAVVMKLLEECKVELQERREKRVKLGNVEEEHKIEETSEVSGAEISNTIPNVWNWWEYWSIWCQNTIWNICGLKSIFLQCTIT